MINDLIEQKKKINEQIVKKMYEDTELLKRLADDMAEAATSIQGQGYSRFIETRNLFFNTINKMHKDYTATVISLQTI